jgi:flagellar biosynthetic protein FliO
MNGELIWAVVRMLVALPLILGLAYVVLKYGLARRYMTPAGNRRMKLVEQLPLGPKTTLSLVSLGGRFYLLAHQDNSVSLVKELDELKDTEEKIIGDIVEYTPRTIKEYDRLRLQEPPEGTTGYLRGGFIEKCRSRLNKLAGWLAKHAAR